MFRSGRLKLCYVYLVLFRNKAHLSIKAVYPGLSGLYYEVYCYVQFILLKI